jgi:hypothetical protein
MKARLAPSVFGLILACALSAAGRQADTQPVQRLAFPDKDWALDFSAPGYEFTSIEPDPGVSRVFLNGFRRDPKRSPMLWVRMEPARHAGSAAEVRDSVLRERRRETGTHGTKTYEYKQIPVAKFRMGDLGTMPTQFRFTDHPAVAEAYVVRDGTLVTFTLISMNSVGSKEEELLHAILDSIRFADTSRPSNSFDYFHKGRALYQSKEIQKSIAPYRSALDLERRQRRLDVGSWRMLVENLSNAYGAADDLAAAKEVIEYGLQQDPTYGLFHYTRARLHAASNDLDSTVASLEKAYQYRDVPDKANLMSFHYYDPRYDRVFDRFKEDEKFKRVLKAWKK